MGAACCALIGRGKPRPYMRPLPGGGKSRPYKNDSMKMIGHNHEIIQFDGLETLR